MSTSAAPPAFAVSRLRSFVWRYPEWWVLAVCVTAWGTMLTGVGHSHDALALEALRQHVFAWMAMTTATMLPAVVPQVHWIALGSFWHRRHRAIAGFVLGYLVPWCAAGCIAAVLLLPQWTHHRAMPVVLFLLAAAWQRTGSYRAARRLCHRTIPLAPLGWRADRDCLRYGSMVGVGCVRACFPLMLACAATGHSLIAMAGGCLLGLLESWWPRPPKRALLAGTLALAMFYCLMAVLPGAHPGMKM